MTETNQPNTEQTAHRRSRRSGTHYQIPKEPGQHAALILAGVMHGLLFLFLWFGIHWQSKTPVGVDAEIWDVKTRDAAPEPVATTPPPPPTPEVKPEPPRPSPEEVQQAHDAEIALERAKEKKIAEEKEKQAEQKREEEKQAKEQARLEKAKIAAEKKEQAKLDKLRDDTMKRMLGNVAGNGTNGDAVKSTGNNRVDAGYGGKIAAKIKSNLVYVSSGNEAGNPSAEFRIDLLPDGELRGLPKLTKSSGYPVFDEAVAKAIQKSQPFPADKNGVVPSTFTSTHYLKDQQQ